MKNWMTAVGAVLLASVAAAQGGGAFEEAQRIIAGDATKVLALVDSGQVSVRDASTQGYTLLHYAADWSNLELVKGLLARGADPAAKAADGSTPLSMTKRTEIRRVLLAALPAAPAAPAAPVARPRANAGPARRAVPAPRAATVAQSRKDSCYMSYRARLGVTYDLSGQTMAMRSWEACLKTGIFR